MTQRGQIIGGFLLGETLGEGTYGKVKLGTSMKDSRSNVAVKILDRTRFNKLDVKKEVAAHKLCSKHPNIVSYISWIDTPSLAFVMLEFADGGELFDRINPDQGVPHHAAHFYFRQLIGGVAHIHSRGVCHRDIKPENILLDKYGNIKITDFGLATVFCHQGRERKLHRKCGTAPYVAPEIFRDDFYNGNLTDYWSCGVVLVALLAGCLPWHEPAPGDVDYATWCAGDHKRINWVAKARNAGAHKLLINVLNPTEDCRADLKMIQKDAWFTQETPLTKLLTKDGQIDSENDVLWVSETPAHDLSQAAVDESAPSDVRAADGSVHERKKTKTDEYCSQSGGQSEDWLPSSHDKTPHLPKVKRETCFTSSLDMEDTIDSVVAALKLLLTDTTVPPQSAAEPSPARPVDIKVMWSKHIISVKTVDDWNVPLEFTARVFKRANGKLLVDFRRIQGNGLEFKRQFTRVCASLFGRDEFKLCTQSQPTPSNFASTPSIPKRSTPRQRSMVHRTPSTMQPPSTHPASAAAQSGGESVSAAAVSSRQRDKRRAPTDA